jgi:hypothetical protein
MLICVNPQAEAVIFFIARLGGTKQNRVVGNRDEASAGK